MTVCRSRDESGRAKHRNKQAQSRVWCSARRSVPTAPLAVRPRNPIPDYQWVPGDAGPVLYGSTPQDVIVVVNSNAQPQ